MIPIVLHLLRQKLHQLLIYKETCGDSNSTPPSASKVAQLLIYKETCGDSNSTPPSASKVAPIVDIQRDVW